MTKIFSNIKYILFDLDGTLLPMNLQTFLKGYLYSLSNKMSILGLPQKSLIQIILKGTDSMLTNDGSVTNKEAFWNTFNNIVNENLDEYDKLSDEYYLNEYKLCKNFTFENKLAKELIDLCNSKFKKVILATNPVFPYTAQKERISWIGLSEEDFDYITSYENSHYTKPNPNYYIEICNKLGINADECLMIGNDINEDMIASSKAGIKGLLVTNWMIDSGKWEGIKVSFKELLKIMREL